MKTATVVAPTDNVNSNDAIGGRKTCSSVVLLGPNGEECAILVFDDTDDDAVIVPNETFSLTTVELSEDDDDDEAEEEEDSEYLEFLEFLEESDVDDEEDTELDDGLAERRHILADARALKILSMVYLHPEKEAFNAWSMKEGTDPTVFGRNYFNRFSADTEDDEFADERAEILEEAATLKKLAMDFLHPELGVKAEDASLFGRNYFGRISSPEVESWEEAEERAHILVDAASLKQLAIDYMHPEAGVKTSDASLFGRNYFNRHSAPETEDFEIAEERTRVLAEAAALEKLAIDYMHPKVSFVATVDGAVYGRNFFTRFAAPVPEDDILDDSCLESLAVAIKNANLPGIKSVKTSSYDINADAPKRSESAVNLFGLGEEVF